MGDATTDLVLDICRVAIRPSESMPMGVRKLPNTLNPELFRFLRELRENNNREWFARNRTRFREAVQIPMVGFIETMAPWLAHNAPAFPADTRLNGGSLFRIHRDTRFSPDKTPYKTNVGSTSDTVPAKMPTHLASTSILLRMRCSSAAESGLHRHRS